MIARTILTYDGMRAAPEDGLRRELLGGELYVSPAPSPVHQRAAGAVFVALDAYAKAHGGEAFTAPIDVVLSQVDAVQPDVLYLAPGRLALIGPKNIMGAPSLLVEVLSPSSSDVDPERKLEIYARHGVPEYWIVDPKTRVIVAHADPAGDTYRSVITSADGIIDALTLEGLRFSLPA